MKDYQRKKNNPYYLQHAVYMKTLWTIREYPLACERASDKLGLSGAIQSDNIKVQSSGDISSRTERIAEKREQDMTLVRAVENSLAIVPEEYQRGVWESVLERKRFPDDAHRNTYSHWRSRFIYGVAKGMGYI